MVSRGELTTQLLNKEAKAWRNLLPTEYDRALCRVLDDVNAAPHSSERVDALLALASKTLRRKEPTLTESRVCFAEYLLELGSKVSDPTRRSRTRMLFLLAWMRLGATIECGPESISRMPDLPSGVVLPSGADPSEIDDPVLRGQAREAVEHHSKEVELWNAKQRALGHLHRLATLISSTGDTFEDDENLTKELISAMSLAPGVPFALRCSLDDNAG